MTEKELREFEAEFHEELETYRENREQLERQADGKVALIKGNKIIGVFDDMQDANLRGMALFGSERYLLQDIGNQVHWCSFAYFGNDSDVSADTHSTGVEDGSLSRQNS